MKLLIENWRKYISEVELKETTWDELEIIKDAMALSPLALPFDDLFKGKKRRLQKIGNKNVYEMDSLLKQFFKKVYMQKNETKKDNRIIIDTVPMVKLSSADLSFNKSTRKVEPKPGIKMEEVSLEKYIAGLIKLKKAIPGYKERLDALDDNQVVKISNNLLKYLFPTWEGDDNNTLYNKFVLYKGEIKPLLRNLLSATTDMSALDDVEKLRQLYLDTKKDLIKKDSIWSPVKESYLILSRDPIDVFRMSDHQGLESCHSLPSGKGGVWDDYNICAAAEAHGNGAIAYSIDKKDFEKKFGELSQETLDNLDGEEIFSDSKRGVDGVAPTGRVRLRKLRLRDTEFAALEERIYGKFPPGVRDDLFRVITNEQSGKFENLKKTQGSTLDLDYGERYGGDYEDSDTGMLFADMAETFGIETSGELNHSMDFISSLQEMFHPELRLISNLRNGDRNDSDIGKSIEFDVEELGDALYYVSCAIVFDFKIEVPEIINAINSGLSDFKDMSDFVDQEVQTYDTAWWELAFRFSNLEDHVDEESVSIDAEWNESTETVDIKFTMGISQSEFDSIQMLVDVCETLYNDRDDIETGWEDANEVREYIKTHISGDIGSQHEEALESFKELADQCSIDVAADDENIIINKKLEFQLEDDVFQDLASLEDPRIAFYKIRDFLKAKYVKQSIEKVWNEYEKQLKLPFGDIEKIDLGELKEYIFKSLTVFVDTNKILDRQSGMRIELTFEFDYSSKEGSLPVMFQFMKMVCRMQEDLQNHFSRDLSYKLRGDTESINENKQRSIKIKILRG